MSWQRWLDEALKRSSHPASRIVFSRSEIQIKNDVRIANFHYISALPVAAGSSTSVDFVRCASVYANGVYGGDDRGAKDEYLHSPLPSSSCFLISRRG